MADTPHTVEVTLAESDLEKIREEARAMAQPLVEQRDRARRIAVELEQQNAALSDALARLLRSWPVTGRSTWAVENAAYDDALALLTTLNIDLNGE